MTVAAASEMKNLAEDRNTFLFLELLSKSFLGVRSVFGFTHH